MGCFGLLGAALLLECEAGEVGIGCVCAEMGTAVWKGSGCDCDTERKIPGCGCGYHSRAILFSGGFFWLEDAGPKQPGGCGHAGCDDTASRLPCHIVMVRKSCRKCCPIGSRPR